MDRQTFAEYVNQHLPPHLPRVTLDEIKSWVELGILPGGQLYQEHLHTVIGIKALIHGLQPRDVMAQAQRETVVDQVLVYCGRTERDTLTGREPTWIGPTPEDEEMAYRRLVNVSTSLWPPGYVYVNWSDYDYNMNRARARATLPSWERADPQVDFLDWHEQHSHRISDPILPPGVLIKNQWILPDGKLHPRPPRIPDLDYRRLHRGFALEQGGDTGRLIFAAGTDVEFGAMTSDDLDRHRAHIRRLLENPTVLLRAGRPLEASAMFAATLTVWPKGVPDVLREWAIQQEAGCPVSVAMRKHWSWLGFIYLQVVMELPLLMNSAPALRSCGFCAAIMPPRGHRDRQYCRKVDNPVCYKARNALCVAKTRKRPRL